MSSFIRSAKRVIRSAKKPARTELWLTIKLIAIGILLIGFIGYLIQIIFSWVTSILA
ncbi:MAG: protein translocase SEC61 complex subunit gamma [Candidatus Heimdallarchaeota archaeon]